MSLPENIKVIQIESRGNAAIQDVALPKLRDDYLLIRTTAVAVNQIDWKQIEFGVEVAGTRLGCDYAGIVEEVGPKVSKPFKKGDRVAGFAHGSNKVQPEDGTFGEYIVVKAGVAFKIPDNIKNEQAAAVGLGIATVGQGLYRTLKLPLPPHASDKSVPILIYGGATATGILGLQFAKLSGFTVVTTCSPSNFDYVKSLGADAVFDYRDPAHCIAQIRDFTHGHLQLAWDCVATPESARICAQALSTNHDTHYSSLLDVKPEILMTINPKIRIGTSVAFMCLGEHFEEFGSLFEPKPEDYEFGKIFFELSGRLLGEGKLQPARQSVNRGGEGLVGVLKGLHDSKEGKVRGGKLVYTL